MSGSTALCVTPERRPVVLARYQNAYGWSPSIWRRLLAANGHPDPGGWMLDDKPLNDLWQSIEQLPDWQQVPLVLTFDTGVIPFTAFAEAAELLTEFERRCPSSPTHVNHVPAVAELLASGPEAPLFGMWGTSVSENPFDPWDPVADDYGSGIPVTDMYVLGAHRPLMERLGC